MKKAVVLVSGGMDSLVCIGEALKQGFEVYFLHLNYGQKTSSRELKSFNDIAQYYNVLPSHQKIINMDFLKQIGGSSLTDDNIEVRNYEKSQENEQSTIPSSYVPFRNSIILSLAVSWAETIEASHLFTGANSEDSPGYPDCRPQYYDVFNELIKVGTKAQKILIQTPVINDRKSEIIRRGQELNVPFELSWSCYKNSQKACGVCDSCALRLRGFSENGMKDPIDYEAN